MELFISSFPFYLFVAKVVHSDDAIVSGGKRKGKELALIIDMSSTCSPPQPNPTQLESKLFVKIFTIWVSIFGPFRKEMLHIFLNIWGAQILGQAPLTLTSAPRVCRVFTGASGVGPRSDS